MSSKCIGFLISHIALSYLRSALVQRWRDQLYQVHSKFILSRHFRKPSTLHFKRKGKQMDCSSYSHSHPPRVIVNQTKYFPKYIYLIITVVNEPLHDEFDYSPDYIIINNRRSVWSSHTIKFTIAWFKVLGTFYLN